MLTVSQAPVLLSFSGKEFSLRDRNFPLLILCLLRLLTFQIRLNKISWDRMKLLKELRDLSFWLWYPDFLVFPPCLYLMLWNKIWKLFVFFIVSIRATQTCLCWAHFSSGHRLINVPFPIVKLSPVFSDFWIEEILYFNTCQFLSNKEINIK